METSGKIAVITGAGSGIGRATALALHADGFSVVLAGRRRAMLEETAALAKASPPEMLVVPTDVADPAAIAALFDAVKSTYGRIDLLFNNAGISTRNIPIEDLTPRCNGRNVVACVDRIAFSARSTRFAMMKSQERPPGAGASSTTARSRPMCRGETPRRTPRPSTLDRGPHPVPVARRARIRHRVRPDRHRQRRDHA